MADTVDSITVFQGPRKLVRKYLNLSDATGESAVVKDIPSSYTAANGSTCTYFAIDRIAYNVQGMSVLLDVSDSSSHDLIRCSGRGHYDFRDVGGLSCKPAAGQTGAIRITTNGQTSGSVYDITVTYRKKN